MLKKLGFIFAQILLIFLMTSVVNAAVVPVFPSCSNPQGTLKVSYDGGTHYIVGGSGVVGTDAVYYTSDLTLIQCFCADDGSGIQTNWWKIDALSQSEIDQLVKLGWHYVPSGLSWGLDDSSYMAKNEAYSCKPYNPPKDPPGPKDPPVCTAPRPVPPQLVSVIRNGSEAVVTWTKVDLATHYTLAYGTEIGNYPYGVPNTGNVTSYTVKALDPSKTYYFLVYAVNDCMPSEPSGSAPQGSAVLGLAATGDSALLYSVFGGALLLTTSGIALRKRK
ncbi:MAG: hypothetical protein US67_C0074G0005 [Candidatus Woesebacteria bacterium GW2011_GWD1_38_10]|uniref:Fibronectin type-III domain-containing protein n=2 Tax=Candidatus Woeseibacteriota TaxID=1752722 RepID=A0A0G0KS55_9BACT|nr:MAG: hypothetical protein US67_C0074G0005 [Candidatus Woesebacteria bacterium GW2011_GWD1_38_10]KKQ81587.1 MAG: hypothetical protein UT06_C0058G0008 [Candidatus Woesebacteria bacterium GW2011_GWA1_38_8]